jgi:hypothetical protein
MQQIILKLFCRPKSRLPPYSPNSKIEANQNNKKLSLFSSYYQKAANLISLICGKTTTAKLTAADF